jgi:4-hydroxy-3-polyprenylbenzoate decarboxylase
MTIKMIIVGITGASGIIYGVRLLEQLRTHAVEAHLVMSKAAERTLALEMDMNLAAVRGLAAVTHSIRDIGASIASGSFRTDGMIVAPCSVRTMSEIVSGVTSTLLTRAADVTLKERRRLVLLVRETPLHLGHLRTMTAATEMGAIIMPPNPAFYLHPHSIDDIVSHTIGRVLDLLDIDHMAARWSGGSSA